jgi:poly-gamma-glutamate capsule biosynthesis protein CapA/YwtB (metallophosphatase superfamily)
MTRVLSLLMLQCLFCGCAPICKVIPAVPRTVEVSPAEGTSFPFVYVEDYEALPYTYFRAEGRGIGGSLPCAAAYIKKYRHKKLGASRAEVAYFEAQAKVTAELRAEAEKSGLASKDDSVRLGFVGDLMWIRNNWDAFLGDDVRAAMDTADHWFGNLETTVSSSTPVRHLFPDYPQYNSAPGLVRSFKKASGESYFKVLSLGNNHTLDFQEPAARETIQFLNQENILHNGLADQPGPKSYATFESKGLRFGFYAATWGMNKMSLLETSPMHINVIKGFAPAKTIKDVDIAGIEKALAEMKADGIDFKIISLHWGFEFEMYPDPLQVVVARQIVRAGADVIMGHHPHVEQPMEVCFVNGAGESPCKVDDGSGKPRKALILYSLGDFTTAKFTLPCQQAPMHKIAVSKGPDGAIRWDFAGSFMALNTLDYGGQKRTHHLGMMPAEVPVIDAEFDDAAAEASLAETCGP